MNRDADLLCKRSSLVNKLSEIKILAGISVPSPALPQSPTYQVALLCDAVRGTLDSEVTCRPPDRRAT